MHDAAPCGGSTRLTIRRCMLHRAGHAGDVSARRRHAHHALSPRGLWPSGSETMRPLSAPVHEGRFGDAAYRHRGTRDRDPCHRHLAVDVTSRRAQGRRTRVSPSTRAAPSTRGSGRRRICTLNGGVPDRCASCRGIRRRSCRTSARSGSGTRRRTPRHSRRCNTPSGVASCRPRPRR